MGFPSSPLSSGTAENGLRNDAAAVWLGAELRAAISAWDFFDNGCNHWATGGDGFGDGLFAALATHDHFLGLFNPLRDLFLNVAMIFAFAGIKASLILTTTAASAGVQEKWQG